LPTIEQILPQDVETAAQLDINNAAAVKITNVTFFIFVVDLKLVTQKTAALVTDFPLQVRLQLRHNNAVKKCKVYFTSP